ncbi:hypothetical protein HDU93_003338 [Gonapodya sp. JEL0774]|nr:hypothetical protein HDU93_003338 [Gonapodya sp. JEL0774]
MPCVLRIKLLGARNLPVMDRVSELTDAFAEIKFADYEILRTQIARKTLSPIWNEDFRLEINNDSLLQDAPLEIRVLDFDAFSANDPIGSVNIDLNPLGWDSSSQISGWFPLFDTLRGVRGEVSVLLRTEFLPNRNPFKDSSFGVQFYSMSAVPANFYVQTVLGFVDIMDSADDPEYHWVDSFRTPRTSNEERERVLFRLSNSVRRQLGRKARDMGANAVVGYIEHFDLEEDEREITCRGLGTALCMLPVTATPQPLLGPKGNLSSPKMDRSLSLAKARSLDSSSHISIDDGLAVDAQIGDSLTGLPTQMEPDSTVIGPPQDAGRVNESPAPVFPSLKSGTIMNITKKVLPGEQQLITLRKFPANTILSIGGVVTSRSVKLMDSPEDLREAWWQELREEVRQHARMMGCTHVIGYQEGAAIHDELYVLSASGTAAILATSGFSTLATNDETGTGVILRDDANSITSIRPGISRRASVGSSERDQGIWDEPPPDVESLTKHALVNATVTRMKKRKEGEPNASTINGMNSIWGLRFQLVVGESLIIATAVGTAMFLKALPPAQSLKLSRSIDRIDDAVHRLTELHEKIINIAERNRKEMERECFRPSHQDTFVSSGDVQVLAENKTTDVVTIPDSEVDGDPDASSTIGAESWAINPSMVVQASYSMVDEPCSSSNNLRTSVKVDDDTDEDLLSVLIDPTYSQGFYLSNLELFPQPYQNLESQMHTQTINIIRTGYISIASQHPTRQLSSMFRELYEELEFRLSMFSPCIVLSVEHDVTLPKDFEVMIRLSAVVFGQLLTLAGYLSPAGAAFLEAPVAQQGDEGFSAAPEQNIVSEHFQSLSHSTESLGVLSDPNTDNSLPERAARRSIDSFHQPASGMPNDVGYTHSELDDPPCSSLERPAVNAQAVAAPAYPVFTSTSSAAHVDITTMSYLPGSSINRYVGRLSLHFVKEQHIDYEPVLGGMSSFANGFMGECFSMARSHAAALGGNGIIAFRFDQAVFFENLKNVGYSIVSFSGDIVDVRGHPSGQLGYLSACKMLSA